jgi:hypothetical protein
MHPVPTPDQEPAGAAPLGLYDDMPALNPRPGTWMMRPARFANGLPDVYRGYRSACGNLLEPYRCGGIFVAQNATYASAYAGPDGRTWRLLMSLRSPAVVHRPITCVSAAVLASLPTGTDSIVMPRGGGNMGHGPVVILLDACCVIGAEETWSAYRVAVTIQENGPDAVPADVLADYPALQDRVEEMRARWEARDTPWRRF